VNEAGNPESDFLKAFREAFEEGTRAWNEGDIRGAYAALSDEVEYRLAPSWPQARVLPGGDDVIAFFEDFQETFRDARTSSHEFIDAGGGTVVVGFRVTGTGRSSGAGTEMDIWQVWKLTEELTPTRVTEFSDRSDALKAAGAMESIGRGSE
jgi:ketosteroid isomerase-like protein